MSGFSETLSSLRKREKMTQEELAARLGISKSAVSMYERGQREPELELLEQAQVGEHVYFGAGEYVLLSRKGSTLTLLSATLTPDLTYHVRREPVNWADCTLRSTLNSQTYLDEQFSPEEQALLQEMDTGKSTDLVTVPSREEFLRYRTVMGGKDALWWLRDNGDSRDSAMFVSDKGDVMDAGYPVDSAEIHARTMIRVALPA